MGRSATSGHESFETFQERCSGGVGDNFEVDRFCAEADEHAQVSFYNLWLTGVSSLELERSRIVKPTGRERSAWGSSGQGELSHHLALAAGSGSPAGDAASAD